VAEILVRGDPISDQLLDLWKLREALLLSVPDDISVKADEEHPSRTRTSATSPSSLSKVVSSSCATHAARRSHLH
jgi:hypothetical protein